MTKIIPAWTPRIAYPDMEYTMKSHTALPFLLPVCLIAVACFLVVFPALGSDNITYAYDANGRLLNADYGGGKSFTYTFDKAGNTLTETVVGYTGPTYTLQVSVSPTGSGSVTGGGINCPSQCSKDIAQNQQVSLSAGASGGFKFLGWAGDLSSLANPFGFTLDADRNVTAYFGAASGMTVPAKGIQDTEEMGPGGTDPSYDGNGDEIPDYQQANVASLHTATGGGYATLSVAAGLALVNVQAVSNPSPGDAPALVGFPFGFFEFTVSGLAPNACTQLTLLLTPKYAGMTTYYKHGPEPGTPTTHWYEFLKSGSTGATISQDTDRTRIVFDFCDNQRGDSDLNANGQILDPGGPGEQLPTPTTTQAPTLGAPAIFFLGAGLLAAGGWLLKRKRRRP